MACSRVLLLIPLLATVFASAAPLTVAWRDKPPYHYLEDGVERGFLLARAHRVFTLAGVDAHFSREPTKRIWAQLAAGTRNYCSIGWYQLPERLRVAQFSAPFYRDPPQLVMPSPAAAAAVRAHPDVRALLADQALSIGLVDGASYGADLDALIAHGRNQVVRRTVEPNAVLRMLAANRFSFIFIDQHDWDFARERDPALGSLTPLRFPDMPPGQQRYIVCSKDVAPEVMARLNKAIDKLTAADGITR